MKLSHFRLFALLCLAILTVAAWPIVNRSHRPARLVQQGGGNDYDPAAAAASLALSWRDEHGQIPRGALARAWAQRKALIKPQSRVPGDTWVERGPIDISGRTRALVISPTQPQTMWAGTSGGGIWKTTDGGVTWANKSDHQLASPFISTLAIDPQNANVLYAGTGEYVANTDGTMAQGAGLYKSTDGGETWTVCAGTTAIGAISKVVVSPTNSNIVIATSVEPTMGGIWRSTNAGATWNRVEAGVAALTPSFLKLSPNTVICLLYYVSSVNNQIVSTFVKSTDGGATWPSMSYGTGSGTGPIHPGGFTPTPNNVNVIWLYSSGGLSKSIDQGATFKSQNPPLVNVSDYAQDLWAAPNDAKVAVTSSFCRTTDSAVNWTSILPAGSPSVPKPGRLAFQVVASPQYNGTTNRIVYFATDNGVYRADDILTVTPTSGWTWLGRGIRTADVFNVGGDGPNGLLLATFEDKGLLQIDPNSGLSTFVAGKSGYICMYPDGSGYFASPGHDQNTNQGKPTSNYNVPYAIDPNHTTTLMDAHWGVWRTSAEYPYTQLGVHTSSLDPAGFVSAMTVAMGNELVFAGCNDGTLGMAMITGEYPTISFDFVPGLPHRKVNCIYFDPEDWHKIYLCYGGYTSDNLWMTSDGGAHWASITGTGTNVLPQAPIYTIARSPVNPNVLHVGTEVGLFSTSDGGLHWTTTNDIPAEVAVMDLKYETRSTTLLAGTRGRGVWELKRIYKLQSLSVNPTSVFGGDSATGTVTLVTPASGGATVTLTSSDPAATVPATVTIPPGASSVDFPITTNPVAADTPLKITVSLDDTQISTDFKVLTPTPTSLSLNPTDVSGNSTSIGTVTLNRPGAPGGSTVRLMSDNTSIAAVPATMVVPEGATSANFTVSTQAGAGSVKITASVGGTSVDATLKVYRVTVTKINCTPGSAPGGLTTGLPVATVTLDAVTKSDVVVPVTSDNKAVIPDFTVVVPAGSTTGSGPFSCKIVSADTWVRLSSQVYKVDPIIPSKLFLVKAATLSFVAPTPASVVGGSATALNLKVSLNAPAPAGGYTVTLTSSDPSLTVPSTAFVPAGVTSVSVAVSHTSVPDIKSVTISANLGSITKTCVVTVNPLIRAFKITPTSVAGGILTTGSITLGVKAPAGGTVVTLSSSDTDTATVPASITIPEGAIGGGFTITTKPVTSDTTATITVTAGGGSKSATVTVTPPVLTNMTVSPSIVKGGSATVVKLTVYLGSPAPTGGTVVTLTSDNPGVASAPSTVTVPAGSKTAFVTVTHSATGSTVSVTFTATLNAVSISKVLTVNP